MTVRKEGHLDERVRGRAVNLGELGSEDLLEHLDRRYGPQSTCVRRVIRPERIEFLGGVALHWCPKNPAA